ncbi:MAG: hypothetical protein ACI4BB_05795 [Coprococcus sp.]
MFEKYGVVMTFAIILFWLAVVSGILYLAGVCLKFDKERLTSVREILKTFISFSLLFFLVAWLTQ